MTPYRRIAQIFPGPGGHAASKKSLCGLRIARFFDADGGTPLQRSQSRRADAAGKLIMESNSEKIRYSLFYRIRDKTHFSNKFLLDKLYPERLVSQSSRDPIPGFLQTE